MTNAQSNNTIRLYRLLKSWTEPAITWNSMSGRLSTDGLEAILGKNGGLEPSVQDGYITFDVTESLAAWAAGVPNKGWVLVDGSNGAWRCGTSGASAGGDRSRLQVNFRTDVVGLVPEPSPLAVFSTFGLFLSYCRRG